MLKKEEGKEDSIRMKRGGRWYKQEEEESDEQDRREKGGI